jgi:hypothetical protein
MVLIPRYAFLLVILIGEFAYRPVVCQGMRQFPAPFSIAVMI